MKKIIIIRHAKSSWDLPIDDFYRDLTQKGVDNSYKIAESSVGLISKNAIVQISPATRAKKTAEIFLKVWKLNFDEIEIKNDLYTFDLSQFERIVKSCSNKYNTLILFGHNGAITDFVNKFGNIFIDNVPTSGFVSVKFDTNDWQTIANGKIERVLFPSQI